MQSVHAHFELVNILLQVLRRFCTGCFLQMTSSWKRHKVEEDKSQSGPKKGVGKTVAARAVSGTIDDETAGKHSSFASLRILQLLGCQQNYATILTAAV